MSRVVTLDELTGARVRRSTGELLELQQQLARRLVALNDRVGEITAAASPVDEDAVTQVDVLTASIEEIEGLLAEVCGEIDRGRRRRRQLGLRRW